MGLTIGVDIGGTKVATGVVDENGHILDILKRPTPSTSPEEAAEVIVDTVTILTGRHEVQAVGLGAAGWVDETGSTVLFAPHLAWRGEPLKEKIEGKIGLPIIVENDANAMAWAEACFGAGRGEPYLVCITLGTGIGAGIILDGNPYRGRWGVGAEPGHLRLVPGGRRCECGNRGCWEQYASGRALVAEAQDLARVSPALAGRLLELGGGQPEGITGPEIAQAALEGDVAAAECFHTVGGWLGQGLADIAAMLDPGRFVVGGGAAVAGELLLAPAREAFAKALAGRGHRPLADIREAELGPYSGLVGAADLARKA